MPVIKPDDHVTVSSTHGLIAVVRQHQGDGRWRGYGTTDLEDSGDEGWLLGAGDTHAETHGGNRSELTSMMSEEESIFIRKG